MRMITSMMSYSCACEEFGGMIELLVSVLVMCF